MSWQQGYTLYCHAKIVQERFNKHCNEFCLMPWPAQPSDLSPAEHLWDEMEQAIWAVWEAKWGAMQY